MHGWALGSTARLASPGGRGWRWRHEAGGRSSAGHQLSVAGSWPQTAHLQGDRHIAHLQGDSHIAHLQGDRHIAQLQGDRANLSLQSDHYKVTTTKLQGDCHKDTK